MESTAVASDGKLLVDAMQLLESRCLSAVKSTQALNLAKPVNRLAKNLKDLLRSAPCVPSVCVACFQSRFFYLLLKGQLNWRCRPKTLVGSKKGWKMLSCKFFNGNGK